MLCRKKKWGTESSPLEKGEVPVNSNSPNATLAATSAMLVLFCAIQAIKLRNHAQGGGKTSFAREK
jgi:hypothetical protein